MKKQKLKAPFPWFGGKSRVAETVWQRFGDVPNYVEPFAGSMAVLLGRPSLPGIETVNDLDCYIANFWRAVQQDPRLVALWADWPVNEADMHARHLWLVNRDEWRAKMKLDPDYYDPKIAGWWVWGISQWIGGGWCSRPEWSGRINVARADKGIHQQDVCWRGRPCMKDQGIRTLQRRPRLSGFAETGVHSAKTDHTRPNMEPGGVHSRDPRQAGQQIWHKRPSLKRGAGGVNGQGLKQQVPDLGGDSGAAGRGVHASALTQKMVRMDRGGDSRLTASAEAIMEWMFALSDRLRKVRVCCGDWKRVLGRSPTECIGLTGVFLDPPYSAARDTVYASDDRLVAHKVREWAIAHGDNPLLRIALCGYEGEHELPPGWTKFAWKTNGGHGNASKGRGRSNSALERIWFNKSCIESHTPDLFPA